MSEDEIYDTVEKIITYKPRQVATHVGKFSHPDAKTNIFSKPSGSSDGFLRSGNVADIELDSPGDAATLGIAKFMFEKLSDGQIIYEHLQKNTKDASDYLSNYLTRCGKDYDNVRKKLLSLLRKPVADEQTSSSELKQVYFPVNADYHLLTVLLPIGLVTQLHERLKKIRFSEERKSSKDARKKGEYSADGYDDIWDLTTISYGGANPQNFSYLAAKLKGCCLLSCLPPKINKRVWLPRSDFFRESIWLKDYESIFVGFHKLQVADWSNEKIRHARDRWVTTCLDRVMYEVWRVRSEDASWSERETHTRLPAHQKKWLDNKYRDERETSDFDAYTPKIVDELVRWFMHGYDKILGSKRVALGDTFLKHVKSLIDIEDLR